MFRSQFFTPWSLGLAAAAYLIVLPGTGTPAAAGQGKMKPSQSSETKRSTVGSESAPPNAVVVVTGTLDLGKITIADYGDVEPVKR